MTLPVYKIETYTAAVLDHTITNECLAFRVKSALTDQLGSFSFSVPGMKGTTKCYDDIALFDKIKFFLGYDTVDATALFLGRVENIQNRWTKDGYIRTFTGRDQGEVTTRLIRHQWASSGGTAHDTVDKWCDDCGLGKTEVAADATAVTILSHQDKYDSLLREICDYAATISKDWYVDISNNLVWKARPIRAAGVSTLTVGDNIERYNLTRNVSQVYNQIWVFGASEPTEEETAVCAHGLDLSDTDLPANHEDFDETINNWTIDSKSGLATLISGFAAPHCGSNYVVASTGADDALDDEWIWAQRDLNTTLRVKNSARLDWYWAFLTNAAGPVMIDYYVQLNAPDTSNYFRYSILTADYPAHNTGTHYHISLGPAFEGASGQGVWIRTGDPSWYDIQDVRFYGQANTVEAGAGDFLTFRNDCIYFSSLRWNDMDEDAGSQTSYGVRPYLVIDDRIHSTTEASNYAATVKDRFKDVPLQLDVIMPMDTNMLIGDRIPITIAHENLSAQDFDVIRVEHVMSEETGFLTRATLVSKERMRSPLMTTDYTAILREMRSQTSNLTKNVTVVK